MVVAGGAMVEAAEPLERCRLVFSRLKTFVGKIERCGWFEPVV
jgi:hypothetical protein